MKIPDVVFKKKPIHKTRLKGLSHNLQRNKGSNEIPRTCLKTRLGKNRKKKKNLEGRTLGAWKKFVKRKKKSKTRRTRIELEISRILLR